MKSYNFDQAPAPVRYLLIGIISSAIVFLDYMTGPDISFSLFYLIPLALVTLGNGRWFGYAAAVIAALIWGGIDVYAHKHSNDIATDIYVHIWNGLVRFGFFILSTSLIAELNEKIDVQERIEKVKAEFMATVTHELRTPLTSIKGALALIRSGAAGEVSEKVKPMVDIAYRNSERVILLINDILDIEKMQSGKLQFHMEPMDVDALLDEAIVLNKGYGDAFGVTFQKTESKINATVIGDKNRLMQVLSNLMSNAAKFSPHGSVVELAVSDDDKRYRIEVKDFGIGIPAEFHNKIFERFSQSNSAEIHSKKGTGLGLNITKMIVDHHDGNVWFESEVNQGSTFYVDLPKLQTRLKSCCFGWPRLKSKAD